jgi:hypothetical protein
MKTLLTAVALAAAVLSSPAHAVEKGCVTWRWQCGDIEVQLNKLAVHHLELSFTGPMIVFSPGKKPTRPFDFKWVGENGAMLNGKMCTFIEETFREVG